MEGKLIRIDKNGTKYYEDHTCPRCGGRGGADAWAYTGWTCYECGGTGRTSKPTVYKVYTPEYELKLAERRAKRREKELAKQRLEAPQINASFIKSKGFGEDGNTHVVLGNTFEIRAELKALGCVFDYILGWHSPKPLEGRPTLTLTAEEFFRKNPENDLYTGYNTDHVQEAIANANDALKRAEDVSEYVGEVGERITVKVTLKGSYSFETHYTYSGETNYIHTFEDEAGNVFKWKTTDCLSYKREGGSWVYPEKGDALTLTGTVKAHEEYKGTKQTVLTRCKYTGR